MPEDAALAARRERMVETQIAARGITEPRVLRAMRAVPRHRFVDPDHEGEAYGDYPIGIGYGQTISQPYIVAYMTDALAIEPGARVLEIGTGSGYQTAVLAEIAGEVYSVEVVPELTARAADVLDALGYTNVHIRQGDGWEGWPEHAPYDAILVAAAPEQLPPAFSEQLREGGRLVIPVGPVDHQELLVLVKRGDRLEELSRLPVRFVPLVRGN